MLQANPNSACLPSVVNHLVMHGQHGAAKRLAELVQSGAFTSGNPRSWTHAINAHMADIALLEEVPHFMLMLLVLSHPRPMLCNEIHAPRFTLIVCQLGSLAGVLHGADNGVVTALDTDTCY